jgi:hypothetical protein
MQIRNVAYKGSKVLVVISKTKTTSIKEALVLQVDILEEKRVSLQNLGDASKTPKVFMDSLKFICRTSRPPIQTHMELAASVQLLLPNLCKNQCL